ncbi:MAG: FHA domain-containing protein [Isosphaeraceae bacterium]|nr:FHA domain-containing protein [Isosphaeraceae bacterium]
MDHQLVVLRGRSVSSTIKLAGGVTTAGRQEDCQLRIKSSQVSRKHCRIYEKDGVLMVEDLGSSNGTFVNNERIDGACVLDPGDEIAIGPITFRVEKIGGATPKAAPAAPTGKAGDTAITQGIATKQAVPDDEFEIIFDDDPVVETVALSDEVPPVAPAAESKPSAAAGGLASARKTEPPKPAAPAPETPPPPPEDANSADDAVADFLLDLKMDDDD